jgi:non-ribosomal peptide synthetase component E (peptide arylation enzyme)
MKPTLLTKEMRDEFFAKGLWDNSTQADLCDENAIKYPNDDAVVDSKSRLTWSDLKRQSDKLALGLLERGFKRDDVIAIQLYNCTELYVTLIACAKAGIVTAPVQPTYRQATLEAMFSHMGPNAAIIPWNFRDHDFYAMYADMQTKMPGLKHIIVIGNDVPKGAISFNDLCNNDLAKKYGPDYLNKTKFKADEVANISTTSGTTGVPKLMENIIAVQGATGRVWAKRIELTHKDVIGAFYGIIGGGMMTVARFSAPTVGAKLALLERFSPKGFCELVQKEKVSVAGIVPAEMAMLLEYPDLDKYDLSSLRLLHNSTSLLPYHLGVRAEDKFHAVYGQTYGSMDCGAITTTSISDPREVRLGTVGHAYDGNEIKVVDDAGKPVPQGEIGQVLVQQGAYSTCGFFKNPELNAKTWQGGWYDPGEKGRIDKNGNLTLVGRKRDVIIRGGQNIYPKDVEETLIQHPKISNVAVIGMPDPVMGEKVCAYVVPKAGQTIDFEEIKTFLRSKKLEPFKIPERIEILSAMPMSEGLKVDKKKLEKDLADKMSKS